MNKQEQIAILNEETKKHAKREREALVIDFDEAVKEQESSSIQVKFRGEIYSLPSDPPAWLPLFLMRNQDENGVISDDKNLEMIGKLLGDEFADKIMDAGNAVSFNLVNEKILFPVLKSWNMEVDDIEEDSGN